MKDVYYYKMEVARLKNRHNRMLKILREQYLTESCYKAFQKLYKSKKPITARKKKDEPTDLTRWNEFKHEFKAMKYLVKVNPKKYQLEFNKENNTVDLYEYVSCIWGPYRVFVYGLIGFDSEDFK